MTTEPQTPSIRLVAISGSIRRASHCTTVLRSLPPLLPPGVTLDIFPLDEVPLYNADLDGDKPPEYGNNARGTGQAGFSRYVESDDAAAVYADRSLQMVVDIDAANYPTKKVNVVAKLRVVNAAVAAAHGLPVG